MKNLFRVFIALAMLSTLGLPMLAFAQDDSGGGMGAWDGCPVPENLPSDVSIGVVFGLSGSVAVYGEPQQRGVELAVKEINDSAYLGDGVTLTAVFEDGGSDAEASIAAFDKRGVRTGCGGHHRPDALDAGVRRRPSRHGSRDSGDGCEQYGDRYHHDERRSRTG